MLERFMLSGRACALWVPEVPGPWPVVCLCGGDMAGRLPELSAAAPGALLAAPEADWARDYTPWPAAAPPGREPFSGGGGDFCAFLTGALKPYLDAHYPTRPDPGHTCIMGYSLGGLFALWAALGGEAFGLAASLSGSLWYEGWPDYLAAHPPGPGRRFYLSLGRDEHRAGGEQMRLVRARTEETATALGTEVVWNRGGHFTGVPNRWRRGLAWAWEAFDE